MSDTPAPEWLPYAQDHLKDRGFDHAADCLGVFFDLVPLMEDEARATLARSAGHASEGILRVIAIIAKARGETPEQTAARLSPPPDSEPEGIFINGRFTPIVPGSFRVNVREGDGGMWQRAGTSTAMSDLLEFRDQIRRSSVGFVSRPRGGGMSADLIVLDDPLAEPSEIDGPEHLPILPGHHWIRVPEAADPAPFASPLKPGLADYVRPTLPAASAAPSRVRKRRRRIDP